MDKKKEQQELRKGIQKGLKNKLDYIEKVKLEKELQTLEHVKNDRNKYWQETRF